MLEDKAYEAEINDRNSLDANDLDSMSLTNMSLTQDAYQESLNENIESGLARFYIEDKEDIVEDIEEELEIQPPPEEPLDEDLPSGDTGDGY